MPEHPSGHTGRLRTNILVTRWWSGLQREMGISLLGRHHTRASTTEATLTEQTNIIPIHPNSFFNQALAATNIDYFRIVTRKSWQPEPYDVDKALERIRAKHAAEREKAAATAPEKGQRS